MNNGVKMTVTSLLIVMIPTTFLKWGVIIKCYEGLKNFKSAI